MGSVAEPVGGGFIPFELAPESGLRIDWNTVRRREIIGEEVM
jgi:hypothetical protein